MTLPTFKYHPDPLKTGSITPSPNTCICCGKARGYIYTGPTYAADDIEEALCPWCIADGSAHKKFDAIFTDDASIGGGEWDEVSDAIIKVVSCRTPGFSAWQQEKWWTHCNDAAEFIGRAGHDELQALGAQAIDAIRHDAGLDEGKQWNEFFTALDKDNSPTAYLFRCRKCGTLGGYQDFD